MTFVKTLVLFSVLYHYTNPNQRVVTAGVSFLSVGFYSILMHIFKNGRRSFFVAFLGSVSTVIKASHGVLSREGNIVSCDSSYRN